MGIACQLIKDENEKKKKKGFLCFCKPLDDNPKLIIEKQGISVEGSKKQHWVPVFESDIMEGNESPEYDGIEINMFKLCQNNKTRPLRFTLVSEQSDGRQPFVYGHCELSVKEIEANINKQKFNRVLIRSERGKAKLGANFVFKEFEIVEQSSFIDYLKAGWYINTRIAIDFTASNGSLHHIDPTGC